MARPSFDPIDVALGARLRVLRLLKGLAQQDLAVSIGVTFQQVQKYERGANRISASILARISACLEMPIAELIGEGAPHTDRLAEAAELLAQPGALSLLYAYGALPAGRTRESLLALVTSASANDRTL